MDCLFYQLSSLFRISFSPSQAWCWACWAVLPPAAVGSASVHQRPAPAGLAVEGNPGPGVAGQANKQNTSTSWAELAVLLRNGQNPRIGTQRSEAAVEHLCTHFTWCEGWSRSRSRTRSSLGGSVRAVKHSAFHTEWLYSVWTFSGWISRVISAFLLSGLAWQPQYLTSAQSISQKPVHFQKALFLCTARG